jgi:hypothetical protein
MKKHIYANIICDERKRPVKAIVSDGYTTNTISITNTRLSVVKKSLREIYGVTDIYVSVILPGDEDDISGNPDLNEVSGGYDQ